MKPKTPPKRRGKGKSPKDGQRTNIYFDKESLERLKILSAESRRSMAAYLEVLIDEAYKEALKKQ